MSKKKSSGKKSAGWTPLKKGDIIDIVAPGSKTDRKYIPLAKKYIESLGFKARLPKDLFGKSLFFSNNDDYRLQSLKKALAAKDSRAIWCFRGGYGSARLLPGLNKIKKPKTNKFFIGYSDMTALHLFFGQRWGWSTVHGPMLERLSHAKIPAQERRDLDQMLFGKSKSLTFKNLKPLNKSARKKKTVRGPIIGGNIAMVTSLQGTPYAMKPKGRILFLEDIGERGYKVDRLLNQLRLADAFRGVRAIVFGTFTECDEADGRKLWKNAIQDFALTVNIPVFSGLPCGHGPYQRPMPLNTKAVLKCGAKGELQVDFGFKK